MKKINTENAPAAIGPYSQAVVTGNLIFVSGQLPINPSTGNIDSTDTAGQTEQSIKNIAAILESCGSSLDKVVKCTVLMQDLSYFGAMNEVYGRYFKEKPARAAYQVARLPKDALIEIEAIAELD